MAPTMLKWLYIGGEDDSEDAARRGEQRAWAGDLVVHDIFGQGRLDSVRQC